MSNVSSFLTLLKHNYCTIPNNLWQLCIYSIKNECFYSSHNHSNPTFHRATDDPVPRGARGPPLGAAGQARGAVLPPLRQHAAGRLGAQRLQVRVAHRRAALLEGQFGYCLNQCILVC